MAFEGDSFESTFQVQDLNERREALAAELRALRRSLHTPSRNYELSTLTTCVVDAEDRLAVLDAKIADLDGRRMPRIPPRTFNPLPTIDGANFSLAFLLMGIAAMVGQLTG